MLTPVRKLQAEISQRQAELTAQQLLTRNSVERLRHRWHTRLSRPRNLALSFGAGLACGLLRRSRLPLPRHNELWQLARPLLMSSLMAWWGGRQAVKSEVESLAETGAI